MTLIKSIQELQKLIKNDQHRKTLFFSESFLKELIQLCHCTQKTKQKIQKIKLKNDKELPRIHNELIAIKSATVEATEKILIASEKIETLAKKLPKEQAEELYRYITAIYEACVFQDLTGQRLTTIGRVVKNLDKMIIQLAEFLQIDSLPPSLSDLGLCEDNTPFLRGPALPSEAPQQDDIDQIFKSKALL